VHAQERQVHRPLVFNRFSTKLKARKMPNTEDQWVRVENAFPAVVEPELFYKAQAVISRWTSRISNEAALDALRKAVPGSAFYENRFGGLNRAYALVGFKSHRSADHLEGFGRRLEIVRTLRLAVAAGLRERGARVEGETGKLMTLNGDLVVAVGLGRYRPGSSPPRWKVQIQSEQPVQWTIVGALSPAGDQVQDYWLKVGGAHNLEIGAVHRTIVVTRAAELGPLLETILA
jgi:hypothetical protein